MSKRNAEIFDYDPQKKYEIADFENTSMNTLYDISKSLGLQDVKRPKKKELARLILSKHEEQREKSINKMKEDFNKITFFRINNVLFYHGNEVAKFLEYSDYDEVVKSEDKITLRYLEGIIGLLPNNLLKFHPNTVFVNDEGLLTLIMSSQMPLALQF